MERYNQTSLDTICGSLCHAMGVEPPQLAVTKSGELCNYVDKTLEGRKADRIFMYNPDAIGQWLWHKYPTLFAGMEEYVGLELPLITVMPSVTPVCFSTMYTGAQPEVHGNYSRQTLTCDTFFDAMVRAGKKVALIAKPNCSMGILYRDRQIDYYFTSSWEENLAVAAELIIKDEYDVIVAYFGNYDSKMHKFGPESPEAMGELRTNVSTFSMFSELIKKHWQHHDTLVGFAMDHGCHSDLEIIPEKDKVLYGDHGFFVPSDMNIVHLYKTWPRKKD